MIYLGQAAALPTYSPGEVISRSVAGTGLLSRAEISLTLIILVFGLIALGFLYAISRRAQAPLMVLRIYVITIIVFGTLAIVSAGYSSEQIAPVIGLFGTIAGYILGRSERKEAPDDAR